MCSEEDRAHIFFSDNDQSMGQGRLDRYLKTTSPESVNTAAAQLMMPLLEISLMVLQRLTGGSKMLGWRYGRIRAVSIVWLNERWYHGLTMEVALR